MKYVICVPDGCADLPVPELGGKTPLEVANMPNLDALAAKSTLGRAEVIPSGMPPGVQAVISKRELRDVIEYLASLKQAP